MIDCALLACVLTLDAPGPIALLCRGATDFRIELDLSVGRLARAPVTDAQSFELKDAGDAIIFFRDRPVAGRATLEWISISRVSGRYAHFIAFRQIPSGSLESPTLIAAADCKHSA